MVSDKTGGSISYDVNSAGVEYTPAAKPALKCNLCHMLFSSLRGLNIHRKQWCRHNHEQIVSAPVQMFMFRLKETASETPGAILYLTEPMEVQHV